MMDRSFIEAVKKEVGPNKNIYLIKINFGHEVFLRGIDPDLYIEQLREIGEINVEEEKRNIPGPDEEVTEEHGYKAEILLVTDETKEAVIDLFEFVLEDGVEIETIQEKGREKREGVSEEAGEIPPNLLKGFLEESEEFLQAIEDDLLKLEQNPEDPETINDIFRNFHTLKGNTGVILTYKKDYRLEAIKDLSHSAETLLQKIRDGEIGISEDTVDLLFDVLDTVKEILSAFSEERDIEIDIEELMDRITSAREDKEVDVKRKVEEKSDLEAFLTVSDQYIPMFKEIIEKKSIGDEEKEFCERAILALYSSSNYLGLERFFEVIKRAKSFLENNQLDEFFESLKNFIEIVDEEKKRKREIKGFKEKKVKETAVKTIKTESFIKIDQSFLEDLMNLVGELVVSKEWFTYFSTKLERNYRVPDAAKELKEQYQRHKRLIEELQGKVLDMRMVPVSVIFERFPRLVRDLSRQLGKKVKLSIEGSDTKIDKVILDKLGDPLIHLVRNSIDHGIETEEERKKLGKEPEGLIILRAYYTSDGVAIEVLDDGRGIDVEKVKEKALERGVVSKERLEAMSEEEIINLIFLPGFSTKEEASELSGRGVGMDVVYNTVKTFGGRVHVESQKGLGTKVALMLPSNVAVRKILLVRVSDLLFSIPLEHIEESLKVVKQDIKILKTKPVIYHRERVIPIIYLAEIMGLGMKHSGEEISVVLLKNRNIGIVVDEIVGRIDTVVKPMPEVLKFIRSFSGVSILGDGSIVYNLAVENI